MTKSKISSKVVRARSLAIYELEKFFDYIRTVNPELEPDQAIVLAAFVLADLPNLFKLSPELVDRTKEMAKSIKLKRSHPLN